nr:MAG: polyprotein [Mite flavivirus 2]
MLSFKMSQSNVFPNSKVALPDHLSSQTYASQHVTQPRDKLIGLLRRLSYVVGEAKNMLPPTPPTSEEDEYVAPYGAYTPADVIRAVESKIGTKPIKKIKVPKPLPPRTGMRKNNFFKNNFWKEEGSSKLNFNETKSTPTVVAPKQKVTYKKFNLNLNFNFKHTPTPTQKRSENKIDTPKQKAGVNYYDYIKNEFKKQSSYKNNNKMPIKYGILSVYNHPPTPPIRYGVLNVINHPPPPPKPKQPLAPRFKQLREQQRSAKSALRAIERAQKQKRDENSQKRLAHQRARAVRQKTARVFDHVLETRTCEKTSNATRDELVAKLAAKIQAARIAPVEGVNYRSYRLTLKTENKINKMCHIVTHVESKRNLIQSESPPKSTYWEDRAVTETTVTFGQNGQKFYFNDLSPPVECSVMTWLTFPRTKKQNAQQRFEEKLAAAHELQQRNDEFLNSLPPTTPSNMPPISGKKIKNGLVRRTSSRLTSLLRHAQPEKMGCHDDWPIQSHEHDSIPSDGVRYWHQHECQRCGVTFEHKHKQRGTHSVQYQHLCNGCGGTSGNVAVQIDRDFNQGGLLQELSQLDESNHSIAYKNVKKWLKHKNEENRGMTSRPLHHFTIKRHWTNETPGQWTKTCPLKHDRNRKFSDTDPKHGAWEFTCDVNPRTMWHLEADYGWNVTVNGTIVGSMWSVPNYVYDNIRCGSIGRKEKIVGRYLYMGCRFIITNMVNQFDDERPTHEIMSLNFEWRSINKLIDHFEGLTGITPEKSATIPKTIVGDPVKDSKTGSRQGNKPKNPTGSFKTHVSRGGNVKAQGEQRKNPKIYKTMFDKTVNIGQQPIRPVYNKVLEAQIGSQQITTTATKTTAHTNISPIKGGFRSQNVVTTYFKTDSRKTKFNGSWLSVDKGEEVHERYKRTKHTRMLLNDEVPDTEVINHWTPVRPSCQCKIRDFIEVDVCIGFRNGAQLIRRGLITKKDESYLGQSGSIMCECGNAVLEGEFKITKDKYIKRHLCSPVPEPMSEEDAMEEAIKEAMKTKLAEDKSKEEIKEYIKTTNVPLDRWTTPQADPKEVAAAVAVTKDWSDSIICLITTQFPYKWETCVKEFTCDMNSYKFVNKKSSKAVFTGGAQSTTKHQCLVAAGHSVNERNLNHWTLEEPVCECNTSHSPFYVLVECGTWCLRRVAFTREESFNPIGTSGRTLCECGAMRVEAMTLMKENGVIKCVVITTASIAKCVQSPLEVVGPINVGGESFKAGLLRAKTCTFCSPYRCAVWQKDCGGLQIPKELCTTQTINMTHGFWPNDAIGPSITFNQYEFDEWLSRINTTSNWQLVVKNNYTTNYKHELTKHGLPMGYNYDIYWEIFNLCRRAGNVIAHQCRFDGTSNIVESTVNFQLPNVGCKPGYKCHTQDLRPIDCGFPKKKNNLLFPLTTLITGIMTCLLWILYPIRKMRRSFDEEGQERVRVQTRPKFSLRKLLLVFFIFTTIVFNFLSVEAIKVNIYNKTHLCYELDKIQAGIPCEINFNAIDFRIEDNWHECTNIQLPGGQFEYHLAKSCVQTKGVFSACKYNKTFEHHCFHRRMKREAEDTVPITNLRVESTTTIPESVIDLTQSKIENIIDDINEIKNITWFNNFMLNLTRWADQKNWTQMYESITNTQKSSNILMSLRIVFIAIMCLRFKTRGLLTALFLLWLTIGVNGDNCQQHLFATTTGMRHLTTGEIIPTTTGVINIAPGSCFSWSASRGNKSLNTVIMFNKIEVQYLKTSHGRYLNEFEIEEPCHMRCSGGAWWPKERFEDRLTELTKFGQQYIVYRETEESKMEHNNVFCGDGGDPYVKRWCIMHWAPNKYCELYDATSLNKIEISIDIIEDDRVNSETFSLTPGGTIRHNEISFGFEPFAHTKEYRWAECEYKDKTFEIVPGHTINENVLRITPNGTLLNMEPERKFVVVPRSHDGCQFRCYVDLVGFENAFMKDHASEQISPHLEKLKTNQFRVEINSVHLRLNVLGVIKDMPVCRNVQFSKKASCKLDSSHSCVVTLNFVKEGINTCGYPLKGMSTEVCTFNNHEITLTMPYEAHKLTLTCAKGGSVILNINNIEVSIEAVELDIFNKIQQQLITYANMASSGNLYDTIRQKFGNYVQIVAGIAMMALGFYTGFFPLIAAGAAVTFFGYAFAFESSVIPLIHAIQTYKSIIWWLIPWFLPTEITVMLLGWVIIANKIVKRHNYFMGPSNQKLFREYDYILINYVANIRMPLLFIAIYAFVIMEVAIGCSLLLLYYVIRRYCIQIFGTNIIICWHKLFRSNDISKTNDLTTIGIPPFCLDPRRTHKQIDVSTQVYDNDLNDKIVEFINTSGSYQERNYVNAAKIVGSTIQHTYTNNLEGYIPCTIYDEERKKKSVDEIKTIALATKEGDTSELITMIETTIDGCSGGALTIGCTYSFFERCNQMFGLYENFEKRTNICDTKCQIWHIRRGTSHGFGFVWNEQLYTLHHVTRGRPVMFKKQKITSNVWPTACIKAIAQNKTTDLCVYGGQSALPKPTVGNYYYVYNPTRQQSIVLRCDNDNQNIVYTRVVIKVDGKISYAACHWYHGWSGLPIVDFTNGQPVGVFGNQLYDETSQSWVQTSSKDFHRSVTINWGEKVDEIDAKDKKSIIHINTPTGSGKTTMLPLKLAEKLTKLTAPIDKTILVLQPLRIVPATMREHMGKLIQEAGLENKVKIKICMGGSSDIIGKVSGARNSDNIHEIWIVYATYGWFWSYFEKDSVDYLLLDEVHSTSPEVVGIVDYIQWKHMELEYNKVVCLTATPMGCEIKDRSFTEVCQTDKTAMSKDPNYIKVFGAPKKDADTDFYVDLRDISGMNKILCFLPSQHDCETAASETLKSIKNKQDTYVGFYHASCPNVDSIVNLFAAQNGIIYCTNAIENGVTVVGINIGYDSCLEYAECEKGDTSVDLKLRAIDKRSQAQRRGRVGRTTTDSKYIYNNVKCPDNNPIDRRVKFRIICGYLAKNLSAYPPGYDQFQETLRRLTHLSKYNTSRHWQQLWQSDYDPLTFYTYGHKKDDGKYEWNSKLMEIFWPTTNRHQPDYNVIQGLFKWSPHATIPKINEHYRVKTLLEPDKEHKKPEQHNAIAFVIAGAGLATASFFVMAEYLSYEKSLPSVECIYYTNEITFGWQLANTGWDLFKGYTQEELSNWTPDKEDPHYLLDNPVFAFDQKFRQQIKETRNMHTNAVANPSGNTTAFTAVITTCGLLELYTESPTAGAAAANCFHQLLSEPGVVLDAITRMTTRAKKPGQFCIESQLIIFNKQILALAASVGPTTAAFAANPANVLAVCSGALFGVTWDKMIATFGISTAFLITGAVSAMSLTTCTLAVGLGTVMTTYIVKNLCWQTTNDMGAVIKPSPILLGSAIFAGYALKTALTQLQLAPSQSTLPLQWIVPAQQSMARGSMVIAVKNILMMYRELQNHLNERPVDLKIVSANFLSYVQHALTIGPLGNLIVLGCCAGIMSLKSIVNNSVRAQALLAAYLAKMQPNASNLNACPAIIDNFDNLDLIIDWMLNIAALIVDPTSSISVAILTVLNYLTDDGPEENKISRNLKKGLFAGAGTPIWAALLVVIGDLGSRITPNLWPTNQNQFVGGECVALGVGLGASVFSLIASGIYLTKDKGLKDYFNQRGVYGMFEDFVAKVIGFLKFIWKSITDWWTGVGPTEKDLYENAGISFDLRGVDLLADDLLIMPSEGASIRAAEYIKYQDKSKERFAFIMEMMKNSPDSFTLAQIRGEMARHCLASDVKDFETFLYEPGPATRFEPTCIGNCILAELRKSNKDIPLNMPGMNCETLVSQTCISLLYRWAACIENGWLCVFVESMRFGQPYYAIIRFRHGIIAVTPLVFYSNIMKEINNTTKNICAALLGLNQIALLGSLKGDKWLTTCGVFQYPKEIQGVARLSTAGAVWQGGYSWLLGRTQTAKAQLVYSDFLKESQKRFPTPECVTLGEDKNTVLGDSRYPAELLNDESHMLLLLCDHWEFEPVLRNSTTSFNHYNPEEGKRWIIEFAKNIVPIRVACAMKQALEKSERDNEYLQHEVIVGYITACRRTELNNEQFPEIMSVMVSTGTLEEHIIYIKHLIKKYISNKLTFDSVDIFKVMGELYKYALAVNSKSVEQTHNKITKMMDRINVVDGQIDPVLGDTGRVVLEKYKFNQFNDDKGMWWFIKTIFEPDAPTDPPTRLHLQKIATSFDKQPEYTNEDLSAQEATLTFNANGVIDYKLNAIRVARFEHLKIQHKEMSDTVMDRVMLSKNRKHKECKTRPITCKYDVADDGYYDAADIDRVCQLIRTYTDNTSKPRHKVMTMKSVGMSPGFNQYLSVAGQGGALDCEEDFQALAFVNRCKIDEPDLSFGDTSTGTIRVLAIRYPVEDWIIDRICQSVLAKFVCNQTKNNNAKIIYVVLEGKRNPNNTIVEQRIRSSIRNHINNLFVDHFEEVYKSILKGTMGRLYPPLHYPLPITSAGDIAMERQIKLSDKYDAAALREELKKPISTVPFKGYTSIECTLKRRTNELYDEMTRVYLPKGVISQEADPEMFQYIEPLGVYRKHERLPTNKSVVSDVLGKLTNYVAKWEVYNSAMVQVSKERNDYHHAVKERADRPLYKVGEATMSELRQCMWSMRKKHGPNPNLNPWTFEEAKGKVNMQGASGMWDKWSNIKEFFDDPHAKDIIEEIDRRARAGENIKEYYITVNPKSENKAGQHQMEGLITDFEKTHFRPKPRLISFYSAAARVYDWMVFGPFIERHYKVKKVFSHATDAIPLHAMGDWLEEYLKAPFGDTPTNTAMGDASKYDASQTKYDKCLELEYISTFYNPTYYKILQTLYEHTIWPVCFTALGYAYTHFGQRASGQWNTWVNVFWNGLTHNWAWKKALGIAWDDEETLNQKVRFGCQGDDNIHNGPKDVVNYETMELVRHHLTKVNVTIRSGNRSGYNITDDFSKADYLSHCYVPVDVACSPDDKNAKPPVPNSDRLIGKWRKTTRLPIRPVSHMLGKLCFTIKMATTGDQIRIACQNPRAALENLGVGIESSKALSYLLMYAHVPIIRSITLGALAILGFEGDKKYFGEYRMRTLLGDMSELSSDHPSRLVRAFKKIWGPTIETLDDVGFVAPEWYAEEMQKHVANVLQCETNGLTKTFRDNPKGRALFEKCLHNPTLTLAVFSPERTARRVVNWCQIQAESHGVTQIPHAGYFGLWNVSKKAYLWVTKQTLSQKEIDSVMKPGIYNVSIDPDQVMVGKVYDIWEWVKARNQGLAKEEPKLPYTTEIPEVQQRDHAQMPREGVWRHTHSCEQPGCRNTFKHTHSKRDREGNPNWRNFCPTHASSWKKKQFTDEKGFSTQLWERTQQPRQTIKEMFTLDWPFTIFRRIKSRIKRICKNSALVLSLYMLINTVSPLLANLLGAAFMYAIYIGIEEDENRSDDVERRVEPDYISNMHNAIIVNTFRHYHTRLRKLIRI